MPPQDSQSSGDEIQHAEHHPPMAMMRVGSGVDVVYGHYDSTSVRRIGLDPQPVAPNARAWRPVGRSGISTGRSGLIASNSAPLHAAVSEGRIVLFSAGAQFRYVVFENGQWSPVRMFSLDETVSAEQLVGQLTR
jgi:hypothetical protein